METINPNKRGSHVGVVLSFMLFVTFTIFLYTMLSPALTPTSAKNSDLNSVELNFENIASAEMTSASVYVSSISGSCIEFSSFLNNLNMKPAHAVATDNLSEKHETSYSGNKLQIGDVTPSNNLFHIYNSSGFLETPKDTLSDCQNLNENNGYVIGIVKTGNYIFESKIFNIINDYGSLYSTNYETLKTELGIPSINEFAFNFTAHNGTTFSTNSQINAQNIYAKNYPIEYVSLDGDMEIGNLNLVLW